MMIKTPPQECMTRNNRNKLQDNQRTYDNNCYYCSCNYKHNDSISC